LFNACSSFSTWRPRIARSFSLRSGERHSTNLSRVLSGALTSLTSTSPVSIFDQSVRSSSSRSKRRSIDFGVPTNQLAPASRSASKLSSLTMPRSITHVRRSWPYFSRIVSMISSTVVTSARLPSKTS
jgi:hypothetical protein